jgi:hypothetical protein
MVCAPAGDYPGQKESLRDQDRRGSAALTLCPVSAAR